MNFDEIENLSEENINELFENIDYLTGTYYYTQLGSCTRWYIRDDRNRYCDHTCCVNYYSGTRRTTTHEYINYCYSDGCRSIGSYWATRYGERLVTSKLLYR